MARSRGNSPATTNKVTGAHLASTGVAVGMAATHLTSLVLPTSVPFRFSPQLDAAITAAFIVVSVIGGLISVRVVTRIDPVEAIA